MYSHIRLKSIQIIISKWTFLNWLSVIHPIISKSRMTTLIIIRIGHSSGIIYRHCSAQHHLSLNPLWIVPNNYGTILWGQVPNSSTSWLNTIKVRIAWFRWALEADLGSFRFEFERNRSYFRFKQKLSRDGVIYIFVSNSRKISDPRSIHTNIRQGTNTP